MTIKQRRVRSINRFIGSLEDGAELFVGLRNPDEYREKLIMAGFTENLEMGELVLPAPFFGPLSRFNAEGKYIKHKDQPMETAYSVVEWHWKEWHGPYRIERSKFVDRPYRRYPRTFVAPPSMELHIVPLVDGSRLLVSPLLKVKKGSERKIKHAINLFLEIFGECQLLTENLEEIVKAPIKRLNWTVLPRGKRPWSQLREEIEPIIHRAPLGNQPVIKHRLSLINSYKPDFTAVGKAGFRGYIVLGFPGNNLYVFESLYYGNATYIFGEQWEELSKKTKAEILNQSLQKDRVIHREGWDGKIKEMLSFKGLNEY